jgi:hypothetical protein
MAKKWIYVVMTTTYEAGDNNLHQEVETYENEQEALDAFNKKADAMHNDIYGEADESNADGISEDRSYRDYQISREVGTEFEYQGHISCESSVVGKDKEDFIPFCKQQILDNIDEFEGDSKYGCDLGYELTQGMNCDGTFTYSTKEAMEYLQEWWWDAEQYSEYEDFNFGERTNPFKNVEAFLVRMVVEGVNGLMGKLPIIEEHWNDKLELTPENIEIIKEQLGELSDEEEVF